LIILVWSSLSLNAGFIFILLSSILFILLDEVLMGCWQRRIGPLNLGLIGMLSAFVNGFNLIISHIIVPNLHFNFGFFLFPFFYFVFSFFNYFLLFPFFIFGLYFSLFLFIFYLFFI
jgi:NADH:ubiquinone oxidoreductase subunit H